MTITIRRYEHPETSARAFVDNDSATYAVGVRCLGDEVHLAGWDDAIAPGDVVETDDGGVYRVTAVYDQIQTGDSRGNYAVVAAEVSL